MLSGLHRSVHYFCVTYEYEITRGECSYCSVCVVSLVKMAVVLFQ